MNTLPPITPVIYLVRNRQVILDSDLAALFGVTTRQLNQQIRRNQHRFPEDFAFVLSENEMRSLFAQIGSTNRRGGRTKLPFVLTEHGVVMAANVLNSVRAASMSVEVVRAFVRLRRAVRLDDVLRAKMIELEKSVMGRLDKNDTDITRLFKAVEALINEPEGPVKRIGFVP
jgi:phage regulator Rha-like protein